MSKVLLAVEKDITGKPIKVYCGGIPWDGVSIIDVKDMTDLDNARVSDKQDVICTKGDVRKYTTIIDGKTIKRSYVVLAKAINNNEEMYFITDGISNPTWIKSRDIRDKLFKEKVTLANSELDLSETEPRLKSTEGTFQEVDYMQLQLEYRKYLKKIKHTGGKDGTNS